MEKWGGKEEEEEVGKEFSGLQVGNHMSLQADESDTQVNIFCLPLLLSVGVVSSDSSELLEADPLSELSLLLLRFWWER